jgi:MFS family permease
LVALVLTTWLYFTGSQIRALAVPLRANDLGASRFEVGLIAGVFALAAASSSTPLGRLSDHWGRRRVILTTTLTGGLASLLMARAPSVLWLYTLMALAGASTGGFLPTAMALTGDMVEEARRGQGYAWLTLSAHVGLSMGPAVGGFLLYHLHFGPTFVASALGFGLAWVLAWRFVVNSGIEEGTVGGSDDELVELVESEAHPGLPALLRNRRVVAVWVATIGLASGTGTIVSLIPLYAVEAGYLPQTIGLVLAVYSASNAAIRIPIGPLANNRRLRGVLIPGSLLVFALVLSQITRPGNPWLLAAWLAGGAMAVGTAYVCLLTELSDAVTAQLRGMAMGGYSTVLYLGFAIGPTITGAVAQSWGYAWGFSTVALLGVGGAVAALMVRVRAV